MFKKRVKKDKLKELSKELERVVSIQKELLEFVEVLTKGNVVMLKKMIKDGSKEEETKKLPLNGDDSYKIMYR